MRRRSHGHFVFIERGSSSRWRYAVFRTSPNGINRLPHVTGTATTWLTAQLKAHLHAWWAGRQP